MRGIFTDGVNSASHVGIGMLAAYLDSWFLCLCFVIYELAHNGVSLESDTAICIAEFLVGYGIIMLNLSITSGK
jgi:hypothetical protein